MEAQADYVVGYDTVAVAFVLAPDVVLLHRDFGVGVVLERGGEGDGTLYLPSGVPLQRLAGGVGHAHVYVIIEVLALS